MQVNLRAIGVCHQDTDALRSLANVMGSHPALQDVNLDGNLIGKRGKAQITYRHIANICPNLAATCNSARVASECLQLHLRMQADDTQDS